MEEENERTSLVVGGVVCNGFDVPDGRYAKRSERSVRPDNNGYGAARFVQLLTQIFDNAPPGFDQPVVRLGWWSRRRECGLRFAGWTRMGRDREHGLF